MRALILKITERETFNGYVLGFVLDEKNEDGTYREYYPFFQHMVQPDAVGKFLEVTYAGGSLIERIKNE